MVKTLENSALKIQVKYHGAELASIVNKKTGQEYIWQADPTFWGRHAPVLFPIVGRLQEDACIINDKTYAMKQHGLARNMDFQLVKQNKAALTFELLSSKETLLAYPYPFRLRIESVLQGTELMVVYEVHNPSEQPMYFSIGGHPAFRCPLNADEQRSDYQLVFQHKETAHTQRLDGGIRNGKTELVLANEKNLPITDHLFEEDALVFADLVSEKVTLQKGEKQVLTFDFKDFPYLGIWSKNQKSPFVCIEPWFGVADHVKHNQQFSQKEGVLELGAGKTFDSVYTIAIH